MAGQPYSADPDVTGWVIAGTVEGAQPKMQDDWDGEIHRDLSSAVESLAMCHRHGYPDYHLYELRRVPPSYTGEPS